MRKGNRVLLLYAFAAAAAGQAPDVQAREHGAYANGWPAAHADGANSDYSPISGSIDIELAWVREFPDGMINLGATSDAGGSVFVTTTAPGCHLWSLDRMTGETNWCSGRVNRFAVSSAPLLGPDGRSWLADNRAMFAFDRAGKAVWETPVAGFTLSAQFTPSGRLLFVTHIGRVYVLDGDTGAPVLEPVELLPGATYDAEDTRQPTLACMLGTRGCPAANTVAVDADTGRFYFTFFAPDDEQAALRAMQYVEEPEPALRPLWTNGVLPGGSGASPALSADGSRIYVGDNVDSLYALDAASGRVIWSMPVGYPSRGSPSVSPEGLIMVSGAGPLLAVADCGDRAELLWRRDDLLNRGTVAQTAGRIGYAVVEAAEGQLEMLVIDTASGAVLDREAIPGDNLFTVGTTIAADGTVLAPTLEGKLLAWRPAAARPPAQSASGPGGSKLAHGRVLSHRFGDGAKGYWIFLPADPRPARVPIVAFLHGWGGIDPWHYAAWIDHIVRRGSAVIYPNYQEDFFSSPRHVTENALAAVTAAIERLASGELGVMGDVERFALAGHSAGGLLAMNLAALASGEGLPAPKAVMAVTPGKRRAQSGRPLIPTENWEVIGPPTLLLAVANEDDRFVGDTDAKAIYRRTRLIPTKDKDLIVLRSDLYGDPDLVASHNAPTTGGTLPGVEAPPVDCTAGRAPGPYDGRGWRAHAGLAEVDAMRTLDALDWYGTWKLFDGLTDAAFYGRNREYALGGSKEQRFMGHWSDGTPVRPLDVLRPE